MALLTIIRGLPGSGKSTLAKAICADHKTVCFEADMYFLEEDGSYTFDQSLIKEAHEWCQRSTKEMLEVGIDVVVANTFVHQWEMRPYLDMDADIQIIHCQGNFKSIHNVPDYIIERMREQWEHFAL